MREKKEDKRIARRELFKLAGLGSIAGAAVVAGTTREAKADNVDAGTRGSGYRETDHVKMYYKLAKF